MKKWKQLLVTGLLAVSMALTTVPVLAEDVTSNSGSTETQVTPDASTGQVEGLMQGASEETAPVMESASSEKAAEPAQEVQLHNPSVSYSAHVQNIGWQGAVAQGQQAGTTGQSLRLEAIQVNLNTDGADLGVQYRTHIQNIGWESGWHNRGEVSGTTGRSLRLEAIQMKLTGADADKYDLYVRVHAQNIGWMGWAKASGDSVATAGTSGASYRLEAIEIKIVQAGAGAPAADGQVTGVSFMPADDINYSTHVQNIGWQGAVGSGKTSGTTGRSLRLEAITINTGSPSILGIQYRTHIQNIGWESSWHNTGEISGTTGQSLRLEAIQIKLTGEMSNYFDVYYRVHAQNIGWMGWTKNGEPAGTEGMSYRLEAIQIVLRGKNTGAPGSTNDSFRKTEAAGDFASSLKAAKQYDTLIIVQCSGTRCTLTMHKRKDNGTMQQILSTSGWIGANGLGVAREGASITPKGIFQPDIALGIKDNPGCGISYHKVNWSDYWNGDSNSSKYNQLVSTNSYNAFSKGASEHLIQMGRAYDYILNIGYNKTGTPYAGSAYFLHVSTGRPTAGCVSVPENDMITILKNVTSNTAMIIDTQSGVKNY